METPVETATRLLAALDDLALQEGALLRSLDVVEAVQVAEKAAPLVEKLCSLSNDPGLAQLRPRIMDLVQRRRCNATLLDAHLGRLQSELRRIDEARTRLAKVAPVYGGDSAKVTTPRLNTAA